MDSLPLVKLKNMTIDQLIKLEDERMETMSTPSFQEWMKSLNVGRLHVNPESKFKARELNQQYDFRKNKVGRLEKLFYL